MNYLSQDYKNRELLERVAKLFRERGSFTDDEYAILQYRLHFDGFPFESIENVAKILKFTPLKVRNIQDKASRKLFFYVTHPERHQD